jgi:hypothetical protein
VCALLGLPRLLCRFLCINAPVNIIQGCCRSWSALRCASKALAWIGTISLHARIEPSEALVTPYWCSRHYSQCLSATHQAIYPPRQQQVQQQLCILATILSHNPPVLLYRRQVNAHQCISRQRNPARQQRARDSSHQPHYSHPILGLPRTHPGVQVSS